MTPALRTLLDDLTAERYDNRWWTTPTPRTDDDSEVTTARRRRALLDSPMSDTA